MQYGSILLTLLCLAACTSPEMRAKRETEKQVAACTQEGYQQGTPAFLSCLQDQKILADQRKTDRLSTVNDNETLKHPGMIAPEGYLIPLP